MLKILKSKAFRRGFVDGFTAPYTIFFADQEPISYQRKDLVKQSWAKVGKAVRSAMQDAGAEHEPRPSKSKASRARDHAA